MIKSLFVLSIFGICTQCVFFVAGQNCSAQITSQKSDKCVFECIKKIYDKQHCSISTDEEHSPRVTLNSNDILPSLMNYDSINYVIGKHIFAPNNSECESSNENFEKTYIGYFKPMDLVRYYNCTRNITVNSDDSSKVNCTTEEIHQLYENITKRFGDDKWCTDAIGLNVTFMKSEKLVINAAIESNSNETTNATVESTTLDTKESAKSLEAEVDVITSAPIPNMTSENPTNNNTESEGNVSTTQIPATSVTNSSDPMTKSTNLKTKKKAEEHHYMGSVKIIISIVGVLLTILIVAGVVVRICENRRKHIHARTSSTTYVFEANH